MKSLKYLISISLMLSGLTAYAQQNRVGIGHRTPTEQLDVKGIVRIQELPEREDTFTQTLQASMMLVKLLFSRLRKWW